MATQALVNPEILIWARNRSGLSLSVLAKKLSVPVDKVSSWEKGEAKPTFRQAQKIAATTHTPFGYLFLPSPPEETLSIPDLRTISSQEASEFSTNLKDIVKQVTNKQAWFRNYLIQSEEKPLPFIGQFKISSPINDVVKSIRYALKVAPPSKGSWEDYQRDLIKGAESAGILVMRSGIVGNNTRRKLKVSEFRGFAISDDFAPVVFINSSDAPTARLFTLIHELAHIWIGSSGISNGKHSHVKEEAYCNAVAGEFLAPKDIILKLWDESERLLTNLSSIATRLHVSKLVIARRALDTNLISNSDYKKFYQGELDSFNNTQSSGGDFYRTAGVKNSSKLSSAIVSEALSGRMLLRDAGQLLGVPPHAIKTYARKLSL